MDLKISDLPPQFENIAIELGIDKIKALFKEFGGTSVTFLLKRWYIKKLEIEKLYLSTMDLIIRN